MLGDGPVLIQILFVALTSCYVVLLNDLSELHPHVLYLLGTVLLLISIVLIYPLSLPSFGLLSFPFAYV